MVVLLCTTRVRLYALGPYENQGQTPCEHTQVNARGRVPDGGIQIVRAGYPKLRLPDGIGLGGLGGFAVIKIFMKHAIESLEFILQTKGFRHGAGGQPMDNAHNDNPHYSKGYSDGQKVGREYSKKICEQLGLVDPVIHT